MAGKMSARPRPRRSLDAAIEHVLFREGRKALVSRNGPTLNVLVVEDDAPGAAFLSSSSRPSILKAFERGEFTRLELRKLRRSGPGAIINGTRLLDWLAANPDRAHDLIFRFALPADSDVRPPGDLTERLTRRQDPWFSSFWTTNSATSPRSYAPGSSEAVTIAPPSAPPLTHAQIRQVVTVSRRLNRPDWTPFFVRRGDTLIALLAHRDAPQFRLLNGQGAAGLFDRAAAGEFRTLLVRQLHADGRVGPPIDRSSALQLVIGHSDVVDELLVELSPREPTSFDSLAPFTDIYFDYLESLATWPDLIDFIHAGYFDVRNQLLPGQVATKPPFNDPQIITPYLSPQPKRRSVVFLHNNYYHFNHLTHALRQRGWDAVTVSLESPDSAQRQFMHGEDISLYDTDPMVMEANSRAFFQAVPERFGAVQFTGQGVGSFFADNFEASADPTLIPWDLMELRRHGLIIGFTPSGCLDGPRQSSIRAVSGGVCGRCVWELRPDVCSDAKNGAWARKVESMCDWVSTEGDWAVDERTNDRAVRRPITIALDSQAWRPDIAPPDDMRVERAPGEILIYHAVGNYEARRRDGRDIKGSGAVLAAIEALKADGLPVRLIFATDIPSTKVRFLQVQADIVVDQLNYGRHGANARESFMLGKPVVARVNPTQGAPLPPLAYMQQSPAVAADESTVYQVLKDLIAQRERWPVLGAAGRQFAMQWHDQDVCALRFERVIDRIAAGLVPEHDEVFA